MRGAAPVASVVVPTRDRPAQLAWCLAALQAQTVSDFEIVVVDDASSDPGAVAAVVSAVPRSRLVVASGGGPAQARNLGAVSSRSSVLCFTDDDCRPDPGWLAALVGRIESGADAVAGHTRNGRPGSVLAAASQLVTNHLSLSSYDSTSGSVGFAPTCNIACRQEIHAAVPFDETFPLPAGEDRD